MHFRNISLSVLAAAMTLSSLSLPVLAAPAENGKDTEDMKNAIFRYKAAVEANPTSGPNHLKLGRAYLTGGEYDNAVKAFQQAVKFNPEDPEGFMGLARAYGSKGEVKAACDSIKEAVRLAPNQIQYRLKYARLLSRAD